MLAPSQSALAAANAVIPTDPGPGTSNTVINNYQQVNLPANDDGTWPCGGAGNAPPPCPGPDGETGPTAYPIGFNINFFGTEYNSAYINNNGNITFGAPLSEFTPSDLTTFSNPIIAPFFADVDTRGTGSADVNFGTGTLNGQKVFVVNWPGVGCFNENSSVLDNFQLILIDRPDRGTGSLSDDFDMEFNFNTIQWDTGEASGGDANCGNGPTGNSAYVGYSNGTSTAGDSYNLPGSGVPNSFLDSSTTTGLIYNDLNSTTLGRYLFTVHNGQPTAPTSLATSLSGGGQSGTSISVPSGTAVTDSATLSGANASTATGTVTYNVYSDSACSNLVQGGSAQQITTPGTMPDSNPVTLSTPGTYYWTASYSGDSANQASQSQCGAEKETVTAVAKGPAVVTHCHEHGITSVTDNAVPGAHHQLVVDYVSAQGPVGSAQSVTVSGSGLTWTRVAQENTIQGDVEVWVVNSGKKSSVAVTATAAQAGFAIAQTEVIYKNATGIGASGTFSSPGSGPVGSITTTQNNSWVWAVGFDPQEAFSRVVGPNQKLFTQTKADNTTSWVQTTTKPTPAVGTSVTINDTAPTSHPYNLILVEIR